MEAAPKPAARPAAEHPAAEPVAERTVTTPPPAPRPAGSGATATGEASDSPGLLSGNLGQLPLEPVLNLCGNTVDVVAALNPVFGNRCEEDSTPTPPQEQPMPPRGKPPVRPAEPTAPEPKAPPRSVTPPEAPVPVHEAPAVPPAPRVDTVPAPRAQLARTGAEPGLLGAAAASAALLGAGAVLYRRGRATARP
nr:chaplin family protein [Streptomyces sp. YIM 121038]